MAKDLAQLARTRNLLGIHSSSCSHAFMEFFGLAGLDYAIIGTETEPVGRGELEGLLRACAAGGVTPIVKLRRSNADELDDALVAGAEWIALPHIVDREQLDALLVRSHYRPQGVRAVCPTGRTFGYSTRTIDEVVSGERGASVIPIIEDPEALENLDALFSAPPQIFEVGPFDLAVALGVATSSPYTQPVLVSAMRRIADAARRHDKLLLAPYWHPPEDEGEGPSTAQQEFLAELGVRLFYLGSEFQVLRWAIRRGRRALTNLDQRAAGRGADRA